MQVTVIRSEIVAGNPGTLLANVLGHDALPITRASITSISVNVKDLDAGTTTWTDTPLVSECVFDTYQSDERDPYYNLAVDLDDSSCPTAGHTYRVTIVLTPSSAQPFDVVAIVSAR